MKWNIMIKFITQILVLAIGVLTNHSIAASDTKPHSVTSNNELDVTLEGLRVKNNVPAMAVGVIDDGEIVYQKGFGLDASGQAVTHKTKFRIASITKLFTAQAVMQLIEQNKLHLSDDVGAFLPEFSGLEISIFDLITHYSGLKDKLKPRNKSEQPSFNRYLQQSLKKQDTLDKSFKYADINFNVLGRVIAKISGKTYPHYIKDHIIKPLNITETGFNELNSYFSPDVEPHINGWFLRKAELRPFDPTFSPSEGLVVNISDLLIWLNATLTQDEKLLKPRTFKKMITPKKSTDWGSIKMGLGWQVYSNESGVVIQHAGSFRGVKALLIAYPESHRGIIILSNANDLPRWGIAAEINKILDQ